jgi:hypothetical protein
MAGVSKPSLDHFALYWRGYWHFCCYHGPF